MFNFEVEDEHTYFVGENETGSVLVHNECPVHDYTLFPDSIDKYINGDRNGINHYLFGTPYASCTCHIITPTVMGRVESYSLGKLAVHSPSGMSLQNQIYAKEQIAGYTNDLADGLQAAQTQLAVLPLNIFGGPIVEEVGETLAQAIVKRAPKLLNYLYDNRKIINTIGYAGELINTAATLLNDNPIWHKGTFDSAEESFAYHFEKHGSEVGAKTMKDYLSKAKAMKDDLRRATTQPLEDGVTRYFKNGQYIDLTSDNVIISFGKRKL